MSTQEGGKLPPEALELLQVAVEHMRATSPTANSEDGHNEFTLRFDASLSVAPVALECGVCGKCLPLLESLL